MSDNVDVVRRVYEDCINPGRLDRLDALVAPEYEGPNGERGAAGFATTIQALRAAFPDIRFALEELFGAGDKVCVRWTWRGTHQATFMGFPPTGKAVANSAIGVYQLREGRIVRAWLMTDRVGFLQQVGAIPSVPELAARLRPA